ncbi:porin [Rhodomicrobium sp.]|uniref:porin n=1 Tax=Rhodomicrobium sp. TaxID=2720632 RepID=UPI0039E66CF2
MMGGLSFATTSAKAADLGADDLEARVAELEATTARKGNRKVSLTISGQVNKAILAWDDGKNSDAYIVDNTQSSSRISLKGSGTISSDLKAGFYQEFEYRDAASGTVAYDNSAGKNWDTDGFRTRQNNAWIESKTFGRVTVGLQNVATKDITYVNLAPTIGSDSDNNYFAGFKATDGNNRSNLNTSVFWNSLDSSRVEAVRYDTPSLYGFIVSASFAGNDFYDVALRYQKEFNSIRVAAGIGYAWSGINSDNNGASTPATSNNRVGFGVDSSQILANSTGKSSKIEVLSGSISAQHVPTGLYASFAAGSREITNPAVVSVQDASYFYIQAGISKRFLDYGATTVYGEYGQYDDYAAGALFKANNTGDGVRIGSSTAERYGAGVIQAFDAAALDVYAIYQHIDLEAKDTGGVDLKLNSTDAVISGLRLKF